MKLITKEQLIRDVHNRWIEQYKNEPQDSDKMVIYESLKSLGDGINKESVDRIIGNESWTRLMCHICDKDVDQVVVYNKYESYGCFCKQCLIDVSEKFE